ncbi:MULTISPECIES: DUF3581 domain-containing protein [Shewanella]|uniref:DUF3581 family protein n=1 Tax=Shewanella japonica TaxID=93973 RepID=A0ABM6JPG1_9GAMM|nr:MULTISPECIES: DUF3581 domain-containing protein [Shewanella]ARD23766.1 hypothetical protein SJ2017_3517 [Shewanella japonica]KPZ70105.1 hypothetical protein AN944_02489 [Shewanella sp. P1-14-1]MBQ4889541.1 DUF3581 domain-containing protein [Shewanella sp. MMG014]OBT08304.1 hypothetical protein A9267_11395 [Shewanella sp. UCD-FRSSP16_17]
MFLSPYYAKQDQSVFISAQQASDFAKLVAEDFNPIHNVGAKRFCVPGDLLFALVLTEFGLSQNMQFKFAGMVGDGVELTLDKQAGEQFSICDTKGKEYLHIERQGDVCQCDTQTAAFIKSYVAFSGLNFIHVLVPMMKEYGMMINPNRPLVIYESMSFQLDTFEFSEMSLELVEQHMEITGKRGDVTLQFALKSEGKVIGSGIKTLVLSGLREYDEEQAKQMCHTYESSKLN